MKPIPTTLRTLLVALALGTVGLGRAQVPLGDTFAADERGAALFAYLVDEAQVATLQRLYDRVREALSDGIASLNADLPDGPLSPHRPTDGTCVYLVGTGGTTPRLDGGGDLLTVRRDPFVQPDAHPAAERIVGWWSSDNDVYVIDEFDLVSLAMSLRAWRQRPDFAVGLSAADFDAAWRAAYGYRVSLYGEPRQPESTAVPHGHLVAYHALSQLPLGSVIRSVRLSRDDRRVEVVVESPDSGFLTMHFVAVDFDRLPTITDALEQLPDTASAAVVMSWGLVDCLLAAGYEALPPDSGHASIMAYFAAAVQQAPGFVGLARELCRGFEGAEAEPLLGLGEGRTCDDATPEELTGLAAVIAVAGFSERARAAIEWEAIVGPHAYFAAAGNQGLGFPMPPAAWPEVTGVEACAREGEGGAFQDRATFSNAGSFDPDESLVRALGAWFVSPEAHSVTGEALGYWGTSFAAPTAALRFLAREFVSLTCP